MNDYSGAGRREALRRAFDESFSRPVAEARAESVELLLVRVEGDPFALPLSELAGLHKAPPIVRVPGPPSTLVGIAGFRGRVLAVHDLGLALGYRRSDHAPRWIVRCREHSQIALALADVEGQECVTPSDIRPNGDEHGRGHHLSRTLNLASGARPVLDVSALVTELRANDGSRAR